MKKCIVPLAMCAFAVPALAGPDFNPPAWRDLPNSTTQGWDFIFGFTYAGDLSDDRVVPTRNPNELPERIVPLTTNPTAPCIPFVNRARTSQPNLSDDFLTLLGTDPNEEPARLMLAIPNFESASSSLMRIQLTYRVAGLPALDIVHATGLVGQPDIATYVNGLTDRFDPERGSWRQATIDLEFSRTSGWQAVIFTNTSGLELDIESIVVDTLVPAPGTTATITALGLMAFRRRRPR
ncbi:MAG: hypothetical protein NTV94_19260 [Planctomycetota bacterium]|nr:hypothetical protein [Planctomycetota bacterium]